MKINKITSAVKIALIASCSLTSGVFAEGTDPKIETIIVTGQKIDRTLQETPASVVVVTRKNIEQQNINDLYDVFERTPNVTGDFGAGFSIRGIDAFNVSGGGNSYLASVYVDGAALPSRMIQQGGFSTWDVSQVEVLRGPQSTLQGRNALAGAVVMSTQDPNYEWDAKARFGYGDEGRTEAAIAFGGELIENQAAFRFSGEKSDFNGVNKNTYTKEDSGYKNSETYRMKILLEPSNMPDFSAMLSYTHNKNDMGVLWTDSYHKNPYKNRTVSFDAPTLEYTETDLYNIELEYELNEFWSLTAVTSYSDSEYGYEWDGDRTPETGSILVHDRVDETISHELRAVFEYDKFSGVVGAYYSNLEVNDNSGGQRLIDFVTLGVPQLLMGPTEYGGLGLPPEFANDVLSLYSEVDPVKIGTRSETHQKVTNAAIFADGVYQINDQWNLFAGIRWDREKQENSSDAIITIDNANLLPNPIAISDPTTAYLVNGLNAQLLSMASDASGVEPLVDASFNAFLPKLGVSYHWSEEITTSFTAQEGYRSGGVGTNIAKATTHTYEPEYTKNYELSFRSVWLEGRLSFNANIFYVDWEDQQVTVQLSANQYDRETRNAGSSTVKGFELELFYQYDNNFSFYAGTGKSKTEFDKFEVILPTVTYDLSGRSFADAPESTANFGATYTSDDGLTVNINANYVGSSKALMNPWADGLSEEANDFDPENDARTIMNARIGYKWEQFGVYLVGTNIFDKKYVRLADTGSGIHTLGEQRQLTLRVEAKF